MKAGPSLRPAAVLTVLALALMLQGCEFFKMKKQEEEVAGPARKPVARHVL